MSSPTMTAPVDGSSSDTLRVGGIALASRLIVGTGKYATYAEMARCLAASGTECVTVAVRRERLVDAAGKNILDHLDPAATRSCPTRPAASRPTTPSAWPGWAAKSSATWAAPRPTG